MSYVTSVVLITNLEAYGSKGEDGPPLLIEQINEWLKTNEKMPLVQVDELVCCGKHPETFIGAGGYNYFPVEKFAEFVVSLPWEDPESVVLIMHTNGNPPQVVRIIAGGGPNG